MGDLQWALLIVGGVIVLAIYFWSVWIKPRMDSQQEVWGESNDTRFDDLDAGYQSGRPDFQDPDTDLADASEAQSWQQRQEPTFGDADLESGAPSRMPADPYSDPDAVQYDEPQAANQAAGIAVPDDDLADGNTAADTSAQTTPGRVPMFLEAGPDDEGPLDAVGVETVPDSVQQRPQLEPEPTQFQQEPTQPEPAATGQDGRVVPPGGWQTELPLPESVVEPEAAAEPVSRPKAAQVGGRGTDFEPLRMHPDVDTDLDLVARREMRLGGKTRAVPAETGPADSTRVVARETSEGLYELAPEDDFAAGQSSGDQRDSSRSESTDDFAFAADPDDSPFRYQDEDAEAGHEAGDGATGSKKGGKKGGWLSGMGRRLKSSIDALSKPESRAAEQDDTAATADEPELILVVYVVAPRSSTFKGYEVEAALESNGLQFGDMDIFHRMAGNNVTPVFSVADMLEPGHLRPDHLQTHSTPGLVLFMRLPGPAEPFDAFEDMVRTVRHVADRLGGELRDERRSVLTQQTIEHMRERVTEYVRQKRLAAQRAEGNRPKRRSQRH